MQQIKIFCRNRSGGLCTHLGGSIKKTLVGGGCFVLAALFGVVFGFVFFLFGLTSLQFSKQLSRALVPYNFVR